MTILKKPKNEPLNREELAELAKFGETLSTIPFRAVPGYKSSLDRAAKTIQALTERVEHLQDSQLPDLEPIKETLSMSNTANGIVVRMFGHVFVVQKPQDRGFGQMAEEWAWGKVGKNIAEWLRQKYVEEMGEKKQEERTR